VIQLQKCLNGQKDNFTYFSFGVVSRGGASAKWVEGTKWKKLKHMVIIFVVFGIRNVA